MPFTPDTVTNFGSTTVAGGAGGMGTPLNPTDTTLRLPTGDGNAKCPSATPFMLQIGSTGLAKCTFRSGDTLTIVRGTGLAAPDTTGADPVWPVGTSVYVVVTAGTFADVFADLNTDAANIAANVTTLSHINQGRYYVQDYGAVADGVTDDGPAIRSALSDINTAGGGELILMRGTHYCSTGQNAENNSFLAIGFTPSNTTISGHGPDVTIIKLQASAPNGAKAFMNWHIQSGGDANITIHDLTFDGNAANQTNMSANGCRGVHIMRAQKVHFMRVRFKDMYGTNGGSTESTATTLDFCADCTYLDCESFGSAASPISDTGFALNFCNNIDYIGCVARGVGGGGFTSSFCSGILHVNCYSFSNGLYGFNAEQPQIQGVRYVNCQCGGATSLRSTNFYNQGQRLGNASHGFVVLGGTDSLQTPQFAPTLAASGTGGTLAAGIWTVAFTYVTGGGETLVGPTATATTTGTTSSITSSIPALPPDSATGWNIYVSSAVNGSTLLKSNGVLQTGTSYVITAAGSGAAVPASNTATYTITTVASYENCTSNYNGGSGLFLSTVTSGFARINWVGGELIGNAAYGAVGGDGGQMSFSGHPRFSGNGTADLHSGGVDHPAYGGLSSVAVPASGTEIVNPFWIPVKVFVNGGTLTTPFIAAGKSGAEVQIAASTNVIVPLGPGEYIKLTYSGAPAWTWASDL